ncbi:hypothetical protein Tco_0794035, partial [Tanacetum coccineum]
MNWYDYGYLEEIEVQRKDQHLYKFKEGDFPRLNLRDIEDMLLLLVQKKLSNLERDVIFDLGVALRMFTRRIVILKRVEDLQLGVESYQKKLNITKPETFKSSDRCTDKTKITRKPSKTGKHGHENGRPAQKKPGNQDKVKKSKLSNSSLSPGTKDAKLESCYTLGCVKTKGKAKLRVKE